MLEGKGFPIVFKEGAFPFHGKKTLESFVGTSLSGQALQVERGVQGADLSPFVFPDHNRNPTIVQGHLSCLGGW